MMKWGSTPHNEKMFIARISLRNMKCKWGFSQVKKRSNLRVLCDSVEGIGNLGNILCVEPSNANSAWTYEVYVMVIDQTLHVIFVNTLFY